MDHLPRDPNIDAISTNPHRHLSSNSSSRKTCQTFPSLSPNPPSPPSASPCRSPASGRSLNRFFSHSSVRFTFSDNRGRRLDPRELAVVIMRNNKTSGLSLKKHLFQVSKLIRGRTRSPRRNYRPLDASPSEPCTTNHMGKIRSWCRRLTSKMTKFLSSGKPVGPGHVPVGRDPVETRPAAAETVPKGHLAVYVGRKGSRLCRVLVPVLYLNHPLFGDLLRKAEEEFGFSGGGGGINIPCEVSEFERVKSQVAAAGNCGRRSTWKRHLARGRIW